MKYRNNHRVTGNDDLDNGFEKRHKRSNFNHDEDENRDHRRKHETNEKRFTCLQCGNSVATDREMSGVNNRNHCPNCLWSRHVDEFKAGDRKAECKSRMRPIGLTIKHIHKRYGSNDGGELMVVHLCTGCGKISINRIAADDDAMRLYDLFMHSEEYGREHGNALAADNVRLLGTADLTTVYSQLFGWQAIFAEFESDGVSEIGVDSLACKSEDESQLIDC